MKYINIFLIKVKEARTSYLRLLRDIIQGRMCDDRMDGIVRMSLPKGEEHR